MAVKVTITPSPRNSHYAQLLREQGAVAEQRREYRQALRTAAKPMAEGVTEDLGKYMPHRGGYLRVLGGALKTKILPRDRGVTIRDNADGKANPRDVRSLQKGRLRHPVFKRRRGRRGQSIMSNTTIPPGFFTEPITARANFSAAEMVKAMRAIAKRITGG